MRDEHAGNLRVTLSEEHELLGSAGTLRANRQWLGDDAEFWVLYSDVLTTLNFPDMLAQHRRNGSNATLGVYEVDNPNRCGIVTMDSENRITSFIEKPENPASNLAFSGIMVASPKICDLIPSDKSAPDIGFDLLSRLVGQMHAYPSRSFLLTSALARPTSACKKNGRGTSLMNVSSRACRVDFSEVRVRLSRSRWGHQPQSSGSWVCHFMGEYAYPARGRASHITVEPIIAEGDRGNEPTWYRVGALVGS